MKFLNEWMKDRLREWVNESKDPPPPPFTGVIMLLINSAFLIELTISYRLSILGPLRPCRGDWAARALLLLMSTELSPVHCRAHLCVSVCDSRTTVLYMYWVCKMFCSSTLMFSVITMKEMCNKSNVTLQKDRHFWRFAYTHIHRHTEWWEGTGNPSWTRRGITGVQE